MSKVNYWHRISHPLSILQLDIKAKSEIKVRKNKQQLAQNQLLFELLYQALRFLRRALRFLEPNFARPFP